MPPKLQLPNNSPRDARALGKLYLSKAIAPTKGAKTKPIALLPSQLIKYIMIIHE